MRKGFTLIELMIVLAIPGLRQSLRASNERNASASLRTVGVAQADFRSNHRDNNRVQDFWTADVAGLYAIDNTPTGTPSPVPIRLIEVSVAPADLFPRFPGILSSGAYGTPVSTYGPTAAKAGYGYIALGTDEQVSASGGNGMYRQATDGTGEEVHNASRFGFAAVPDVYGSSGSKVFIVNEAGTIFQRDFGMALPAQAGFPPPSPNGTWNFHWPTDAERYARWSKLDRGRDIAYGGYAIAMDMESGGPIVGLSARRPLPPLRWGSRPFPLRLPRSSAPAAVREASRSPTVPRSPTRSESRRSKDPCARTSRRPWSRRTALRRPISRRGSG